MPTNLDRINEIFRENTEYLGKSQNAFPPLEDEPIAGNQLSVDNDDDGYWEKFLAWWAK